MIKRFRAVIPGYLYRGSGPSPKDVLWLKSNFNINKIVSLDKEAGERIEKTCKLLNIKQIKAYIEINDSYKSLLNVLNQDLKELLLDDAPTFFHCKFGKDRSGLICALFKCKYLNVSPKDALKEAESLGFGIGVEPKIVDLYKKLINNCKPEQDINNADIVSNTREYISDNRSSPLQEATQMSFAPFLSKTRQYPYDAVYNEINNQSPTRENYDQPIKEHKNKNIVPLVGVYNNGAGIIGVGPVISPGGFIYD